MALLTYLIHLLLPWAIAATCTVPPDFWCDHPKVANQCGAERYCQNYKNNLSGRKFDLTLLFETHCPDSQLFIVDRLYPKVISNSSVAEVVNVDFYLWGMAIRNASGLRCKHKRDRTCQGNKLISCAMQHITDKKLRIDYIYCFEGYVLLRLPIEYSRDTCYDELKVDRSLRDVIRTCADGREGDSLLKNMEQKTQSVSPVHRSFVPWVVLNGRSLPEMQVYQLFLDQKLKIWAKNIPDRSKHGSTASASRCMTPPDFWCDNEYVTKECYDAHKCDAYRSETFDRPIKITVIFSSHCNNSQQFIVDILYSKIWQNRELRPLVSIQLIPWNALKEGQCHLKTEECFGDVILACAVHHAEENTFELFEFTACFLKNIRARRNNDQALRACSQNAKMTVSLSQKISACANGPLGEKLQRANEAATMSIEPEKASSTPWLLFNDVSLQSAQEYANIVDRMVCNWYRSPTHNRTLCGKCEYEPTACDEDHPKTLPNPT